MTTEIEIQEIETPHVEVMENEPERVLPVTVFKPNYINLAVLGLALGLLGAIIKAINDTDNGETR